jgi:hypothetical protein
VYSATTGKYRHAKKYYQNGVKGASCSLQFSSIPSYPLTDRLLNLFQPSQTPTTSPRKPLPSPSAVRTLPSPAFSAVQPVRPVPSSFSALLPPLFLLKLPTTQKR